MSILNLLLAVVTVFGNGFTTGPRVECERLAQPKNFPTLNTLLDSAALATGILPFAQSATSDVVISVQLDDTARAYVAGFDSPTALQEAVRLAVLASVRPRNKNSPASFRVLVTVGETQTIAAARSMLCAPTLVSGGNERVQVSVTAMTATNAGIAVPGSKFAPTITVGVDGKVHSVTLGTGNGKSSNERSFQQAYSQRQYEPARLDGRVVAVRVTGQKVELVR